MTDMTTDLFADHPMGKAAIKKIKPDDPNFRLFMAGWVGDYKTTDTMEFKGAVFREAKKGKNKGKLCVIVPGTEKHVFVTCADAKEFE